MENWIISNIHFEDEDLVMGESYFDGKVLEIIGVNLFTYLICLVSFGLLLPYSLCYKYKWLANHTIINKKKIVFSGKSLNLIGSYLLWYLLSIITFGIYGIWMPVKLYGWKVKNTHIKLKDEKVQSTSKVPLVIGFVLSFIIIILVCTLIPKINVNKVNNFFDNIKSSINKKSGKTSNRTDVEISSKDVTCISKESYDKIKQNIKEKDYILECNLDGLVIMITNNNDDLTTSDVINYIQELLSNLSDSELNNINISISFEKVNTNLDFYLYGELVSGSCVIEWKKNDEKFDTTKINTSLNSDKSKSDNQTENVTTKKVVEKTTTVQNKCSSNGIYADGICYDKNTYVYPGSCGYLNEIDGKCYYPGCDETNYLTYENCVNDYANKPSSNECPTGFKYIEGLCYGSVIN